MNDLIKQRWEKYGDPVENMERTAEMASKATGKELTAADIAVIMQCVKKSREEYRHDPDNLADLEAYKEIEQMIKDRL